MFSVWPVTARMATAESTASGIEAAMITVERQLPRNSRIIRLVRAAASAPSRTTPETDAFTNSDWSFSGTMLTSAGSRAWIRGRAALTPSTTAMVEVPPFLRMVIRTERLPSTCTTLVWGAAPS